VSTPKPASSLVATDRRLAGKGRRTSPGPSARRLCLRIQCPLLFAGAGLVRLTLLHQDGVSAGQFTLERDVSNTFGFGGRCCSATSIYGPTGRSFVCRISPPAKYSGSRRAPVRARFLRRRPAVTFMAIMSMSSLAEASPRHLSREGPVYTADHPNRKDSARNGRGLPLVADGRL